MRIVSGAPSGSTQRVSMEYIQINNCGFHEVDQFDITTSRPAGRVDYHLLYVWQGAVLCRTEAGERRCGEGELLIFKPWEPQHYTYLADADTIVYWVYFTGQGALSLLRQSFLLGRSSVSIGAMESPRSELEPMP